MMRRDLILHLMQEGCRLVGEGERQSWWENASSRTRSAVARHTEIADPLVCKICHDLVVELPQSIPAAPEPPPTLN